MIAADEQLFQAETCLPGTSPVITYIRTTQAVEKSHGRLTPRRLTACSLLSASSDWPYLQQVFKIERCTVCLRTGITQTETAYGVTSLTAAHASPARWLQWNRGHWAWRMACTIGAMSRSAKMRDAPPPSRWDTRWPLSTTW